MPDRHSDLVALGRCGVEAEASSIEAAAFRHRSGMGVEHRRVRAGMVCD